MSRNVIGVLPGAKRPDEYVLYTAHWDHLGRCAPVDGDDICNGAVDNATGVAGLVTMAEASKKAGAPDSSVVFLAVTAEDSGDRKSVGEGKSGSGSLDHGGRSL